MKKMLGCLVVLMVASGGGQAVFFALVIMAMTLCSITSFKAVCEDNTKAGRLLVWGPSVKGKGMETTSNIL